MYNIGLLLRSVMPLLKFVVSVDGALWHEAVILLC